MCHRTLYRHPAPGCSGRTVRIEYTAEEWRDAPYDETFRRAIDAGQPVHMGETVVVDPIAFYLATQGILQLPQVS